jgi:mortality factor 4-like protein 1
MPRTTTDTEDSMHIDEEQPTSENSDQNREGEVDDEDPSSFVSPPPYLPDQRCFCRDQNDPEQFYEAVVRKVRCKLENEWHFLMHYLGWNSRWDRWVANEALLPDTPENRTKHIKERKRKKEATSSSSTPGTPGTTTSGGTGGSGSASRKRKSAASSAVSSNNNSTEDVLSYFQEYCELPFTLKTILVEECEKITRKGFDSPNGYDCEATPKPARSVHQLPPAVTIQQVLQHYQRKRGGADQDKEKQQQVRRFCDGLGKLFQDALPVCLLYPQERPQYEEILQDENFKNKSLAEIYGCEMLLRLLVRLPILLQAEPKIDSALSMGHFLADLIVLLQKNRQACFKAVYREPRPSELLDWELELSKSMSTSS